MAKMDVLVAVGMYLRIFRRCDKDGSVVEYLQLVWGIAKSAEFWSR